MPGAKVRPARRRLGFSLRALRRWSLLPGQALLIASAALFGIGATLIGLHDAYLASTWSTRVLAGVLAGSGLAQTVGCSLIWFGRPVVKRIGVGLAMFGLVPPIVLIGMQFVAFEADWRLAVWFLYAGLVVAVLWLCSRAGFKLRKPASISAAVLLTAAVSFSASLTNLRPLSNPETFDARVGLQVVGGREADQLRTHLVQATVTLSNRSQNPLVAVASVYNVHARRAAPRAVEATHWPLIEELDDDEWSGRFESRGQWELIETGYEREPFSWELQPGQTDVTSFSILVPEEFDTVAFDAWYLTARSDSVPLGEPPGSFDGQSLADNEIYAEWLIDSGLWLHDLTQSNRYIWVRYSLERPPSATADSKEHGMSYLSYADAEKTRYKPDPSYSERIASKYGFGQVNAYTELALDGRG